MTETKVAGDKKKEVEGFLQELDGNPYTKVLADVFRDYTVRKTRKRHEKMISAEGIESSGGVFFLELELVPDDGYVRLGVRTSANNLLIQVYAEPEAVFTKERLSCRLYEDYFRLLVGREYPKIVSESWLFTQFIPDLYRRIKAAGL